MLLGPGRSGITPRYPQALQDGFEIEKQPIGRHSLGTAGPILHPCSELHQLYCVLTPEPSQQPPCSWELGREELSKNNLGAKILFGGQPCTSCLGGIAAALWPAVGLCYCSRFPSAVGMPLGIYRSACPIILGS